MRTIVLSLSIIFAAVVIGFVLVSNKEQGTNMPVQKDNVSVVNGRQIVQINARGGYSPRITSAKAGIPTTIKMETKGTFDCSAALVIPAFGFRTFLPATGETLIEVPAQQPGSTLQGRCAMGMYGFVIKFD
ncbi:MAG: cupredoxin domain-containing protein [bacterium]|nr:cupredoxin domain-containing protein [bacterium]